MQPFRILLGTKVVCDLMPNTPANKKTAPCFAKAWLCVLEVQRQVFILDDNFLREVLEKIDFFICVHLIPVYL